MAIQRRGRALLARVERVGFLDGPRGILGQKESILDGKSAWAKSWGWG